MNSVTKSLLRVAAIVTFILLIPLVAMQFTEEVDWKLGDFVIMGALLTATGLTFEFVVRKVNNPTRRAVAGLVLFGALFLIWAELAVGIFGSPFAGS